MSQNDDRDDDRIDIAAWQATPRWRLALVWFMRLMALIWLFKGLWWWAEILGVAPGVPFEERRLVARAATVGFAITDPIAAVGLWLTSVWGGLIWLLSVTATVILSVAFPAVVPVDTFGYVVNSTIVAVYLALTAAAAREEERW